MNERLSRRRQGRTRTVYSEGRLIGRGRRTARHRPTALGMDSWLGELRRTEQLRLETPDVGDDQRARGRANDVAGADEFGEYR